MTAGHPYATCPECSRLLRVRTVSPADDHPPRDVFPEHRPSNDLFGDPCSGSWWLVEDEDRCAGRWPR